MSNRTEINQAKAQHSTGPKPLRHGLDGQLVVMPTKTASSVSRTGDIPKGATETHLVQALADISSRLNRVAVLETNLLTLIASGDLNSITRALANLSLYSERLSRQFESTLTQLRELQEARRPEEGR
jgi:hypothetical protein